MSNKAANPQTGLGVPLPKKENDLFRTVVRHYESKQYKKGMKCADTVLKKFPKHGETLCMKGLILNCTGKKDEAISMVKLGLMNDMRSHVCWHVYGLIYRSERNYNEAIKAYKQALRIDTGNIQILKDLALLQIQMRDYDGYTNTQHTILENKASMKVNWISFALGKHMKGDLDGAIKVIDIFLDTYEEGSVEKSKNYETSELALYKNSIIAEGGDCEKALEHLKECEAKDILVDKFSTLRLKGQYQLQLGRFGDAKETFYNLLERGSTEDYSVHTGYMLSLLEIGDATAKNMLKVKGARALPSLLVLTEEQKSKLKEEYTSNLPNIFPKSIAVKRITLTLLEVDSDEWKSAIGSYLQTNIKRGVPSLGDDVSSLFLTKSATDDNIYCIAKEPVDIKSDVYFNSIVSTIDGYISSLEAGSTFPESDEVQPPSTLLWTWYLRTILHEAAGEFSEGVALADKCLEQTPTGVDLYELKGRLLKSAGDINGAVDCLEKGRQLDKQDRYINNLATKYLLQADKREEALENMALFTRHESDPEQNIFDMQVSWYELELAASYARGKEMGKSLKKYLAVEKHFEDFHEDQFDFHAYCIRKVTMRAYVDLLRWEDKVFGHETYAEAAEKIIQNYLYLHDNPITEIETVEPDYSSMSSAERKKAKAVARKKKIKAEKKAAEKAKLEAEKDAKNKKDGKKVMKDDDPDGLELLKKIPLDEAKKYAATLVKNAPHRLSTWLCQYDVCSRRGKALMALKSLFQAKALDNGHVMNSNVFKRIVDFCQNVNLPEAANSAVIEVFNNEKKTLLNGASLNEFVITVWKELQSKPFSDLSLRTEVAKAMITYKVGSETDASNLIVENGLEVHGASLDACANALAFLKSVDGKETDAETFASCAKARYTLSSKF